MQNELLNELLQYWFSEKEAKVYLIILELGNCIASTVSKKTDINRATAYTILNSLKSRGYINETTKNEIKYYSAKSPDVILKELEIKTEKFKNIVPELLNLTWKYNNKLKVEYFEWLQWTKNALKQILEEWYKMSEPYLTFAWINKNINKQFEKYLKEEFTPERRKCSIKTKAITSDKERNKYWNYSTDTHESIYIEEDFFDIWSEIILYWENKIAILMYSDENLGVVIVENKAVFDTIKSIFNLVWWIYNKK